jgi:DNA-binding PadR family transcriptional regulator
MPRVPRSNPLALAVLVSLYERPMHPYEIAHTLRSRAKHESVRLNYGSLYGVVESLDRRGLIQAQETTRTGRHPERTTYAITDAGAREATQWLAELIAVPQKEYPQFMAGLSFLPALPPEDVATLLRDRVEAIEMRLVLQRGAVAAALQIGLPRLFGLEAEYEIAMAEAELRFVISLLSDLETGTLDGVELWKSLHADVASTEFAVELGGWPVPDPTALRARDVASQLDSTTKVLDNHDNQGD